MDVIVYELMYAYVYELKKPPRIPPAGEITWQDANEYKMPDYVGCGLFGTPEDAMAAAPATVVWQSKDGSFGLETLMDSLQDRASNYWVVKRHIVRNVKAIEEKKAADALE